MKKRQDTIKRVILLIRPYRQYLLLSLFFAAVSVALTLYAPILTGNAIDYILGPSQVDFASITKILIQFFIVVLL